MPAIASPTCFICGATGVKSENADYLTCAGCGHEILRAGGRQQFIVNEALHADMTKRLDVRDRFQRDVTLRAAIAKNLLLDIGCGPGRFLWLNKERFADHLGVEVTESCIAYAREKLSLKVTSELPDGLPAPSVVTLWHSLEHIPALEIGKILRQLRGAADKHTRVVICVPNAGSWQAHGFGGKWTYYDVPNHLHQFSPVSLASLMQHAGFELESECYSFTYIFAGYVLSFANLAAPTHNYFYYRKKRGVASSFSRAMTCVFDLASYLVILVSILPAFLLALAEWLVPARRAVLTRIYRPTAGGELTR